MKLRFKTTSKIFLELCTFDAQSYRLQIQMSFSGFPHEQGGKIWPLFDLLLTYFDSPLDRSVIPSFLQEQYEV